MASSSIFMLHPARSALIHSFRSAAAFSVFLLLAAINVIRTLRHAMWHDELQAFMLAAGSPTLVDLFHNLKYEGHPGLWHALLWIVTRFTTDPSAMQVLHLAIALAIWILIFRLSPFTIGEKFLLVLSYFLFWEYFVVSRSYALMALLGFGFVALRASWPRRLFLPWLLLGLLANTVVLGTIWSIAMAAFFVLRAPRRATLFLLGGVVYAALLVIAILTMSPAPDMTGYQWHGTGTLAAFPLHSFIPLVPPWPSETILWLGEPHLAKVSDFDPSEVIIRLLRIDADHPARLILVLIFPIAFCWFVVRDLVRTAEFTAAYIGVLLFAQLWHFTGDIRHHGIVFIMLVGIVWATRAAIATADQSTWRWMPMLLVAAAGGLATLSSELHPYSQGRNVAAWLERNRMNDAPIIGSVDYTISTIAGYLRRPVYYLECRCLGTFIVWNARRQTLDVHEIAPRITRALETSGWTDSVLILNRQLARQEMAAAPDLAFDLMERFSGAVARPEENYVVYHVRMR
jgi:hypothetical protein